MNTPARVICGLALASISCGLTGAANAATVNPLELNLSLFPAIVSSQLDIRSAPVAGGFRLTVDGVNENLALPNSADRSLLNSFSNPALLVRESTALGVNDVFSLVAEFDTNGDFTGGSFAIEGIAFDGEPVVLDDALDDPNSGRNLAGTLLSGELTAFGLEQVGLPGFEGTLQFGFDSDIATPLGFYGLHNARDGGILVTILSASGTPLDWANELTTSEFAASGFARSVVAPIPGAVWMFGTCLLLLISRLSMRTRAFSSNASIL